jgi:hypothetical protein
MPPAPSPHGTPRRVLAAAALAAGLLACEGAGAAGPLPAVSAGAPVAAAAGDRRNPTGWRLFSPCENNCAVAVYGGPFIQDSMADVLFKDPELPFTWDYRTDDVLLAVSASRHAATLFGRIDVEPEIGFAHRFGRQDESEVWGALYGRWRGLPWDQVVTTTFAASIGFNYAFSVTEVERARADPAEGERLLHFFSPEITFALPSRPDVELLFRFHHRSGVFGVLSDTRGGAHYGTVGLRFRF